MDDGLTLYVKSKSNISVLIQRFSAFSGLKNKAVWEYDIHGEDLSRHNRFRWDYSGRQIIMRQTMFIGKSGYGKSSLINSIIGADAFQIDEVKACTKELDTALFRMGQDEKTYLAFSDLPGVGESRMADIQYRKWYRDMVLSSSCVVYVLRADQRDFSIDEDVFSELFYTEEQKENVVIALNFADKIEPISRSGKISEAQWRVLEDKIEIIREKFGVYSVIPCCAKTGEGITELISEIADILDLCVYDDD